MHLLPYLPFALFAATAGICGIITTAIELASAKRAQPSRAAPRRQKFRPVVIQGGLQQRYSRLAETKLRSAPGTIGLASTRAYGG